MVVLRVGTVRWLVYVGFISLLHFSSLCCFTFTLIERFNGCDLVLRCSPGATIGVGCGSRAVDISLLRLVLSCTPSHGWVPPGLHLQPPSTSDHLLVAAGVANVAYLAGLHLQREPSGFTSGGGKGQQDAEQIGTL